MKNWFRIVLAAVLFLAFTNLGMAQQKNAAIQNLIDKYESGQSITTAEKEMLSQYFNSIYQQATPILSKSKGIIATEDVILGPETFDTFPPTGWSVTSGLSGNAWIDTVNASYGGGTDRYASWDDDAWGSASDDTTHLETPSFSTLGYASVTVTFDYGYRILGGDYAIEASTDGGATWQTVIADLPFTTAAATAKYPESVGNVIFLDAYANQSDVRLRFSWYDAGGWQWYGALDNVLVEGSATTPPPNPALLVGPANAATGVSLIADLRWAPDGGGPSPNGYKIFFGSDGGGVTPPTNIENGTDLGNVTSYSQSAPLAANTTYYWQVVAYNATGDATGSAIWSFTTADAPTVTSFPLTEDFETFVIGSPGTYANGWTNGGGQAAWYVEDSGIQNSGGTGPFVDHTSGTGNYMYTEATGFSPNFSFYLLSPPLDLSATSDYLMGFWYHMFGATMGDLHVDVWSGGSWDLDVTSPLVGPQQTAEDEAWRQKFVDLSAYAGSTVILRFRGITGSSFTSDMAIDDVEVGIAAAPDLAVTQFLNLPFTSGSGATINFDVEISNVGAVATGTSTVDIWLNGVLASTHGVAALGLGEKDTINATIVTTSSEFDTVTAALQTYPGDGDLSNDTLLAAIVILNNIPTPFQENWDTTTFDLGIWPEVTGTTEIIDANGVATGTFPYAVPSDPYFLAMNGANGSLTSGIFDLSGLSDQAVMLWESEHDLEPAESVILEYYTDAGAWDTLAYFPGTDNGFGVFEPFEKHSYPVPADGYHSNFKIRFRTIGALATTDEWFFDNIYIGPATDVGTTGHSAPALTHISNTQPGLLSSVNLGASFLNLGVANTGDLNVAVTDAGSATVYSDAWTGVTLPAFGPASATFTPWDASGAADGDYSINYYTSNFVDVDPLNDNLSVPLNIGTTMAYDNGVQSTSGTFSSTARSWFGINYTLADDDVLNGVTILVSASAAAADSFAVELWTVVNDTPSTPIVSIAEGAYSDLGALPALVTFAIDPGLPLTAGTYSIVFDMKNTASFPCGIDFTALGAANVPRTFWGKLETTTWLAFEDVGAGTWTAIIRAELGGSTMPPTPLPYTQSFEDTTLVIPDGWTQFDADGDDEVPGADWRISPNGQNFPPLDGAGEIFNNYQAANSAGLIDEWLFTPQFGPYQSGMELSFNLIHIDGVWDDSVMVLVSTTDNDPGSFTMIDYINCPIDWTEYSYNLGNYGVNDGDNFYVAFRYYHEDGGSFGNHSNLFAMDLMKIGFPAGPPASKLLLTEIVVTPTEGEFVEIFNPGTDPVDLTNYYLTDATFGGDGTYYYKIVEGGGGGGAFGDFHARFPAGAMIGAGEYQTVAMNGTNFATAYGVQPTYELFDTDAGIPDMLEAFAGSINGQGGLTNSDEVVILYYWDGMSDLVQDVDYLLYNSGSPVANNELVDKTGVSIDGPDPGTDSTMYLPDTPDSLQRSAVNHDAGFSVHRTDFSEGTQTASGGNGVTGADETSENLDATFTNNSLPSPNAAWVSATSPGDPPSNVSATGGPSSVLLTWTPPGVELGYDDGTGEGVLSIGATSEGDLAVRFTPNVYPSTLLAIRVWFGATSDPTAMTSGNYTVWDGTSAGPGTALASGSHPINRGGFETVDVSSAGVSIGADDFFISYNEPNGQQLFMTWDTDGLYSDRSWVNAPLIGFPWQTLGNTGIAGFDNNLMIRAVMLEGSGPNAQVVELGSDGSRRVLAAKQKRELLAKSNAQGAAAGNLPNGAYSLDGSMAQPLETGSIFGTPVILGLEGIAGYNIYRSEDNLSFSQIASVDSLTFSYEDGGLANGTYYYYLTAVYTEGESDPSDTVSATVLGSEPLLSLTHTPGDLSVGIFNDGSIGADQVNFAGPGVSWKGQNGIFVGGPIFGTSVAGSVNGHIGSFSISGDLLNNGSNFAGGFTSNADFDQISEASLVDAGAPAPYGVEILQKSYSNTGDNYVFIRYGFVNASGGVLVDFYSGIFVDWDINASTYLTNSGGVELDRDLVYQYDTGSSPYYYGVAALNGLSGGWATTQTPAPDTRIGSFTWITTFNPSQDPPGDFRTWLGTGLGNVEAGDTSWATFAVVAGDDLDQIRANAAAARAKAASLGWVGPVGIEDGLTGIPTEFSLQQNYPNPFNPTTTIRYGLKEDAKVNVKIYNVLGQVVKTLVNGRQTAGFKTAVWDGTNEFGAKVSSGIYIYRIEANDFVDSKKMILLK